MHQETGYILAFQPLNNPTAPVKLQKVFTYPRGIDFIINGQWDAESKRLSFETRSDQSYFGITD